MFPRCSPSACSFQRVVFEIPLRANISGTKKERDEKRSVYCPRLFQDTTAESQERMNTLLPCRLIRKKFIADKNIPVRSLCITNYADVRSEKFSGPRFKENGILLSFARLVTRIRRQQFLIKKECISTEKKKRKKYLEQRKQRAIPRISTSTEKLRFGGICTRAHVYVCTRRPLVSPRIEHSLGLYSLQLLFLQSAEFTLKVKLF